MDWGGKSDPLAEAYITCRPDFIIKTQEIKDNLNPEWNKNGSIPVNIFRCQIKSEFLQVEVFDVDPMGRDEIGKIQIDLIEVLE